MKLRKASVVGFGLTSHPNTPTFQMLALCQTVYQFGTNGQTAQQTFAATQEVLDVAQLCNCGAQQTERGSCFLKNHCCPFIQRNIKDSFEYDRLLVDQLLFDPGRGLSKQLI